MQQMLSDEMLELISQRFRLLADPMRLKIPHHLQSGEKSVKELVTVTGASQPNVSKHLSTLRTHGLVRRRQEGNMAFFSIGRSIHLRAMQHSGRQYED